MDVISVAKRLTERRENTNSFFIKSQFKLGSKHIFGKYRQFAYSYSEPNINNRFIRKLMS